ncbi:putative short chain dehydrogenase/reductase [Aspergillus clavatus NRRL 1]|uniref:Short chain dehydrogenase/reductase, putative n=1 Tax=Aspergillus clavatus (strain ATCC 1007 / CBS 513.65 / DSM 816 / NCTC 3887 / NRRL 1 / QM 1276 / 107) TaxID=344612 RepID=A1CSJ0_ASPCL|nr:short chain dehydrogenase/reductase, putative [Aspergillus clavatus NRRL 1]EAW06277.1 short chain dehydrogenase/reductase, putative [Aspergillus clavatus NRRL 1]
MSGFFTYRNFSLHDTPALDGKVAVVTGGQAGIGREIVAQLLLHGIKKVYVVARSKSKFAIAQEGWRERKDILLSEDDDRVEFIQCDLADIRSVKDAAEKITRKAERLDILVCNAGMGLSPKYKCSPQNVEIIFAINCVGHQILTMLLLPLIRRSITQGKASEARIVVTSSSLHSVCRQLDLDLLTSPDRPKSAMIDGLWRYGRSKLGNILFTRELNRRLEKLSNDADQYIYVNTFFPGNIVTEQWNVWNQYFGKFGGKIMRGLFSLIGQSTQDGAATAMYLAASPAIRENRIRGQYFIPIAKPYDTSKIANNMKLANELWDWIEAKATETLGPNWQSEVGVAPSGGI